MKINVEVVNDGATLPIPEHQTPNPGNRFLRWTGARVDEAAGTIGPFHANTTVTAAYAFSYSQFTVLVPGNTEDSEIKIEITPLSDESPVIVDFGDGSQGSSNANGMVVTHTYEKLEESSVYDVRITGNARQFKIVGGNALVISAAKLANSLLSCDEMFADCTNLRGNFPAWPDKCETAVRAYAGCTGMTEAIPEWGNSLKDVAFCFYGCTGITGRVPQWKNNIITADHCFEGCTSFGSDADNVIPAWNNVGSAIGCYSGCAAMRGTIPAWTDRVGTDTTEVYSGCAMLTGDIPAWSSGLLVAVKTYYGCSGLVGVNMPTVAETCPVNVEEDDCEDCVTGTSDAVRAKFLGAWGGTYQASDDATVFDVSLEEDGTVSFVISAGVGAKTVCLVDNEHPVACNDGINTIDVTAGAHVISILGEVGAFRIASDSSALVTEVKSIGAFVTNLDGAFENCVNLTEACPISDGVTSARRCFAGCTSLAGSIPEWTTGLVDATECYSGCVSLTGDIPLWGEGLTAVSGCFSGCTGLTGTAATDPAERMPSRFSDLNETRNCVSGCSDAVRALFTPLWGGTEMSGSTVINMTASEDTVVRLTVRIGTSTAISWGDGSIDLLTDAEGEITSTHVYAPGSYVLKIGSGATSFSFDDNGSTAPRSLTAWGVGITSAVNGFLNCPNFTTCAAFPDSLTDVSGLFKNSGMTTPLEWNKAVLAVGTYENCADLEGDIPAWGDYLTDVSACYRNCPGLTVPEDKTEDFEWLMPERIALHEATVSGATWLAEVFFTEWGGVGERAISLEISILEERGRTVKVGYYELASGVLEVSWDGGETYETSTTHTYDSVGKYNVVLKGDFRVVGGQVSGYGRPLLVSSYAQSVSIVTDVEFGAGLTHLEEIGDYAFSGHGTLKLLSRVEIPKTAKRIGYGAFQYNSLVSLTIPETVEEIGSFAFSDGANLEEVRFECKNPKLGQYILQNSERLISVELPDGWSEIPFGFLRNCYALEMCNIPSTVTSIGSSAFDNCKNLNITELPSSIATIDSYAFRGSGVTVEVIPGIWIGAGAFKESGVTKVKLLGFMSYIGNETFSGCVGLKEIVCDTSRWMNSSLPREFAKNSGVESVEIIDDFKHDIGASAFEGCKALKTIRLSISSDENTQWSIGEKAFYGCVNVTDIYCAAMRAPSVKNGTSYNNAFGSTATSEKNTSLVGRNTYSAKTNKLHIPNGAIGYSADEWKSILCNSSYCGFAIQL